MISRRRFVRDLSCLAIAGQLAGESFLARRAWAGTAARDNMVWLDSNENPAGPPLSAIKAIVDGAAATARYHFDEFAAFTEAIARSESLTPQQVVFGIGSSDVIDAAICAFTSPSRPMITAASTYEIPLEFAKRRERKVVQVPLTDEWAFPVRKLAEEAERSGGGLIYLCNPNNPTSSLTPQSDIGWLATNLPPNTVLLVDEAYIDFLPRADVISAMRYVRSDRNVVVTRTFSKIYGMAGARAGFGCAKPDLIRSMKPFLDNVIPILGLRAATAALGESATLIPSRRAANARTRGELCAWLRQKRIPYIEPHANFIMMDIGRDVRAFSGELFRKGVAVGRPFPTLNEMLRVTIGTDPEMEKFREVFWQVYSG
jgi:histidinol-phosphate aminotransferase